MGGRDGPPTHNGGLDPSDATDGLWCPTPHPTPPGDRVWAGKGLPKDPTQWFISLVLWRFVYQTQDLGCTKW